MAGKAFFSFPSDSEPHSRPEICSQRWISDYFFVVFVESVLEIYIGCDPGSERVPAAHIHAHVPRRVSDAESKEIRVWPSPHKASSQISSPALSEISDQRCGRVLGTPYERLSRREQGITKVRRGAQGRLQNLRRSVGVRGVQGQSRDDFTLKFNFGPVSERLIYVHVLANECLGTGGEFNLVAEQVVVVGGSQRISTAE